MIWSPWISIVGGCQCNMYAPPNPSGGGGNGYFNWFNEDSGAASEIMHRWFRAIAVEPMSRLARKVPT